MKLLQYIKIFFKKAPDYTDMLELEHFQLEKLINRFSENYSGLNDKILSRMRIALCNEK